MSSKMTASDILHTSVVNYSNSTFQLKNKEILRFTLNTFICAFKHESYFLPKYADFSKIFLFIAEFKMNFKKY